MFGGGANVAGVVEICFDGQWAAVCDSVGTSLTSDVLGAVCKSLGYTGVQIYSHHNVPRNVT